jgi:NTE family protein
VHEVVSRALARHRIEQFPIGFAAVATEMRRGCMAVFNAGSAAIAAQASAGLPGVIAPTAIGSHLYADGGITAPVPVRVGPGVGCRARDRGGRHVQAVRIAA